MKKTSSQPVRKSVQITVQKPVQQPQNTSVPPLSSGEESTIYLKSSKELRGISLNEAKHTEPGEGNSD